MSDQLTTRKIALGVAWGVLAAAAVMWLVWRGFQPSETECAIQRADYALGNIPAHEVDDACR